MMGQSDFDQKIQFDILNHMKKIMLLLPFIFIISSHIMGFSLFPEWLFPLYNAHKAYQEKNYVKTQELLEREQVEKPNDPLINYNLGTTYYKQGKYDLAKENLTRAAKYAFGLDKNLLEKSRFNLGNCFYKKTLEILPENWDQQTIEESIRKQAIYEVQQAIEHYKNTLSISKDSQMAKTNKSAAEKLLAKLTKQQQQKQDQKKDGNQEKKDQQNQKKQQQAQQQKQQDKQKQEQQKSQQEQDHHRKQQQKQDEQKRKQQNQEEKPPQQQKKLDKQIKKESMENRRVRMLLNQLQEQEKKLQKRLLKQKITKDSKPKNSYQKPW